MRAGFSSEIGGRSGRAPLRNAFQLSPIPKFSRELTGKNYITYVAIWRHFILRRAIQLRGNTVK
jgi:hypothetical protein